MKKIKQSAYHAYNTLKEEKLAEIFQQTIITKKPHVSDFAVLALSDTWDFLYY